MGAPRPNGSLGLTEGPPQPGGGAAAGPGDRGCENGALMDSFGIFLQGLLGVVAFSTLMLKRFREPKHERRPWKICSFLLNTARNLHKDLDKHLDTKLRVVLPPDDGNLQLPSGASEHLQPSISLQEALSWASTEFCVL